jgi:flavin reductase (DIM6/NTAB) family NADH-FMN oxidoreductase RutF
LGRLLEPRVTVAIDQFIAAMRQLAAGVTVVTTAQDGQRAGLTATSVCSVSAEPPQLLVCVNRAAEAFAMLDAARVMAVNVLSAEQMELADRFAGRSGAQGEARFAVGAWRKLATGAPILDDCLASFDCRIVATLDAGTHTVLVGAVQAVALRSGGMPMVYHDGEYGLVARVA